VLEVAQGTSLARQVDEVIAIPLGLTSLAPDYHWQAHPDRVRGYSRDREGPYFNGDDDVSWKLAAGGFQSTPRDFAGWCAGLLSEALLDDVEKTEMLWQPTEPVTTYAYGFELVWDRRGNLSSVAHGGAQQSVRTALRAYPEEGLCLTLMTNSTWADAMGLLRQFETVWREAQE
jgi:CubicO group peptidase (beta-lactamase class C family)